MVKIGIGRCHFPGLFNTPKHHLGPFSEASDRPEGQELGGGAVGGHEELQEVKL